MSLDGAMLRHLCLELNEKIAGFRINKIYQPAKHEINILLRGMDNSYKLILSASAEAPRVNLTKRNAVNPEVPPAFCMLLRKRILSAKVIKIEQKALERVLCINLESKDELGVTVHYKLLAEIMGKHSNIILVNEEGKIVDAIKRVNKEMSSKRLVLPGISYCEPPSQGKMCVLYDKKDEIAKKIFSFNSGTEDSFKNTLYSVILSTVQGVSGTVCDWFCERANCDKNIKICEMPPFVKEKVQKSLVELSEIIKNGKGVPCLLTDENGKKDISFLELKSKNCEKYKSFSLLIDDYFYEKTVIDRQNSKSGYLIKKIEGLILLKKKKIDSQKEEIARCKDKEKYKLFGDLLISNIYKIKKGMEKIILENFFLNTQGDNKREKIEIPLDKMLDASGNAQRYYKKYKKRVSAEKVLKVQIENAKADVCYLENSLDCLKRCESEGEIQEIYKELSEQGYLKFKSKSKIKPKTPSFIELTSPSGYKILIGRNCKQNENLTYRTAGKKDLWFHTKDIPGSHTVMVTNGAEPKKEDIIFAGQVCAGHSKARSSSNVPVDYTFISNVKKPANYKPGMAIYKEYKTIYVDPKQEQD